RPARLPGDHAHRHGALPLSALPHVPRYARQGRRGQARPRLEGHRADGPRCGGLIAYASGRHSGAWAKPPDPESMATTEMDCGLAPAARPGMTVAKSCLTRSSG